MRNALLNFAKCPFCRRDGSKIVIDTATALSWDPPKLKIPELLINLNPNQPVVSFLPRPEIVRPCDHLVYMLLDMEHKTGLHRDKALTLTWLHPRFLEGHKFGDMWDMVVGVDDSDNTLVTPCEVDTPSCSRTIRRDGNVVHRIECSGWVVYAEDGNDLYEELAGVCGWA